MPTSDIFEAMGCTSKVLETNALRDKLQFECHPGTSDWEETCDKMLDAWAKFIRWYYTERSVSDDQA